MERRLKRKERGNTLNRQTLERCCRWGDYYSGSESEMANKNIPIVLQHRTRSALLSPSALLLVRDETARPLQRRRWRRWRPLPPHHRRRTTRYSRYRREQCAHTDVCECEYSLWSFTLIIDYLLHVGFRVSQIGIVMALTGDTIATSAEEHL